MRAGYVTDLYLVDLAPMLAAGRTVSRFLGSGRFVDPIYTLDVMGTNPQTAFEELKTHSGASVDSRGWTRGVEFGQPPRLVEEGSNAQRQTTREEDAAARRLPVHEASEQDEDFETNGVFDFDKATGIVHRLSFPRPEKE